jgi:hypothetical protein
MIMWRNKRMLQANETIENSSSETFLFAEFTICRWQNNVRSGQPTLSFSEGYLI